MTPGSKKFKAKCILTSDHHLYGTERIYEAYKKIAGKTINASWIDFMGDQRQVRYRVPNVNQCKECHAAMDSITPIAVSYTHLTLPTKA